jgi:protein TonB
MPEFKGGEEELFKYLGKELKYPKVARRNEVEGTVKVNFVVNKDGSVSDIKIVQSVSKELDDEAIRVIKKMPKWTPGKQDGEAVRVSYNLPFKYRLR